MSAADLRLSATCRTTWWALAAALAGLGAVGASIATALEPQWIHAATGLWALCIMLLPPAFLRPYDWFSSWSFVMLSVLIGVTLRGFYITFQVPDPATIDQLYLLGRDPEFFLRPSLILLLGLLAASTSSPKTGASRGSTSSAWPSCWSRALPPSATSN